MDMPIPTEPAQTVYAFDAAKPDYVRRALGDLSLGFSRWRLAWALAWLDIRNRYRGSVLGPFWLTLSTGTMLFGLGLLYSTLFGFKLIDYLPHLAVSLIVWNMIAQIINEATGSLVSSEGIIRQMPLPYTIHGLRCVLRNMMTAAHNLPLILIVFLACGWLPGAEVLLLPLGFVLIAVNAFALTMLLGMVCARFRDIGPIVGSVLQLAFFMTPVLWKPELLPAHLQPFLLLNPFYTIMETVRGPLVEGGGPLLAWLVALVYTALNLAIAWFFFLRFRGRVAYWV
jgi:lipopolysaccharide transport system permease protein